MIVRAIKSFVGKGTDGVKYRKDVGDVFELPVGSDWIDAGLVVPMDDGPETAATQPPETAVKPRARKRG